MYIPRKFWAELTGEEFHQILVNDGLTPQQYARALELAESSKEEPAADGPSQLSVKGKRRDGPKRH